VENTVGSRRRWSTQIDAKGSLLAKLEKARVPLRPGEFVVITIAGGVVPAR
jgi:hypothetical protein